MKTISIVSHCYSGKHEQYAKMLTAQLSSLLLWPPKCQVHLMVFTAKDDRAFSVCQKMGMDLFKVNVRLTAFVLDGPKLFRRAIGRNQAAKNAMSDIVWMADCDAMFGEGCLDALAACEFVGLAFPRQALFHKQHVLGDEDIAGIEYGRLFTPDQSRFQPERIKFASGGYIIVDGETAQRGFMDGTKWVEPVDVEHGFRDPREDIGYRKQFESSTPLDLPNLFRIRHSACAFQKAEERLAQTS